MTAFVHVDRPAQHPGVARAEHLAHNAKQLARHLGSARSNASLLLAAIVAALVVAANQVVETWSEGHLLAAWIVMWTIAFAGLALLAAPARAATLRASAGLARWKEARKQAAADEKMWQAALDDARVMADISRAMSQAAVRDIRAYY